METEGAQSIDDRFQAAYWRAVRELDTVRLLQWERFHLTLPQLRLLFQVRRSPAITTAQLSRAMGITVSTTSGLVAKLADAGLVLRGQGADDRRQIPLELTDAGRALAGDLTDRAGSNVSCREVQTDAEFAVCIERRRSLRHDYRIRAGPKGRLHPESSEFGIVFVRLCQQEIERPAAGSK